LGLEGGTEKAMNGVQFQRGLSIMAFLNEYGTVEQCGRAPEEMHWPEGYCCPVCQGSRCSRYDREGQRYWQCSHCRHQTTVISGTIFEAMRFT
jgi:ribosomal protein L37AE/L43A